MTIRQKAYTCEQWTWRSSIVSSHVVRARRLTRAKNAAPNPSDEPKTLIASSVLWFSSASKPSSMAFSLSSPKTFTPSCNPHPSIPRYRILSNPWLSHPSSRSALLLHLSGSSSVLLSKPWTRSGATRCSLRSRPEYIPNDIPDPRYVRIFDTTLRDGEQSPGATMTSKEKLVVARQLSRLGVDIIEAGFPASSPDDLDAVRSIAMEVGNQPVSEDGHIPVICGLARCNKKDIDAAWEAVRHAKKPRVHTFIATSEIHMQHKLKKTREEVVRIAREMVAYARSLGCQDVEFSPEDAGRFFPSQLLC